MGQANKRGTLTQRINRAIKRNELVAQLIAKGDSQLAKEWAKDVGIDKIAQYMERTGQIKEVDIASNNPPST